jgi:hypothetical protein
VTVGIPAHLVAIRIGYLYEHPDMRTFEPDFRYNALDGD